MAEASKSYDEKSESSEGKNTINDFDVDNTVKKIYVNNLSRKISKTNLHNIFSIYGRIESSRVTKKKRGNTTSADITFVSSKSALKAIEAAKKNEIRYNGMILNVVPAFSNNQSNDKKAIKMKNSKKHKAQKAQENEDELGKVDFINILDDDCLIHIFLKLPMIDRLRIERVCKRWQDVSLRAFHDIKKLSISRKLLKQNPTINLRLINNRTVEKLLIRCGRFLTYLKLYTEDLSCKSDVLLLIGDHCHNLEKMVLQFHKNSYENMQKLFTQLIKIQYLEIREIGNNFKDKCLLNLLNTGLKELRLTAKVTDEDFSSCYRQLSAHSSSTFRKLKTVTSLALDGFILKSETIKAICNNKNLTSLSLTSCTIKKFIYKISDLSNLRDLNLSEVPEVSNQLLIDLAAKCPQLNYLNISHCVAVSSSGISALVNLPNLRVLIINDIYEVQDEVLGKLIFLETLHCENCEQIGDSGVTKLIETAPNLKHLNLFNTLVTSDVLNFANTIVKRRTNGLPLHIVVNSSSYEESELDDDRSPLLNIERKEESLWHEFLNGSDDYDDDDDDYEYDDDDDDYDDFDNYCFEEYGIDGLEHDFGINYYMGLDSDDFYFKN